MVESEKFDALIVGAGPAGSFAAERLARAGVRVALFDGRPAGEPKACGGGVTSKALKAWPHLLEAMGRTIDEVEMYSPAGTCVRLKLDAPFAIYSRVAFDSYLRERAVKAGAHIFAERVSIVFEGDERGRWIARTRSGASWQGRVLVAADGANSPIARRLAGALPKAEMEVAFGYRAPLPKHGDAPTVIAFLPGWVGYAWAFPRLDHISFGIATSQDAFDHRSLDALLWEFMIGYYRIREDASAPLWSSQEETSSKDDASRAEIERKLRGSVDAYAARIPGLAVETWNTRCVGTDTWALLGDAAGFADPVTGEGIYYALRSAELFAEAFLAGRTADYEARWRADFGYELRRASGMRRRFYGEFLGAPFTDRMIDFARLHPGIRRTLRELVAGDQGYVNLKRTLARSALWPL
ncbi:MAG TPA: NAD(P)/FAD-dependent oxidoreductase [Pyrinomonadaceae bacterium]|nr:NAD(P)/FAD-dependent oxidoreductase [Pyrinomonadaceae bacterium]